MYKYILAAALSLPTLAFAGECDLEITGSDMMQYDKTELTVPATCEEVSLTLKHSGTMAKQVMGHNWVLAKTADMAGITEDGMKAGLEANYLKADDTRIIAKTKVIGPTETDTVKFKIKDIAADSDLTYFCSFPGHSSIMKGKFIIKK
ncbi:azurin [uncultured Thiothrix sp.]|uniref:azurin n=1 Tax=uncultured Thiothrix sp. TaxID=223185 RepID=UPI00261D434A|nr:azurin [uncultured Thiothrix sp.]